MGGLPYDYAVSRGIPVLGFVLGDEVAWPAHHMETDSDKRVRLEQFRSKAKSRMVNFWESKSDLHAKFSIALMKTFITNPRTGWTKANEVAGPEVMKELTRLSAENATLRKQLDAIELKGREHDRDAHREVVQTLQKNAVTAYVRKKSDDWGEPVETTLLAIFKAISANLLVENSPSNMATDIALALSTGVDFYHSWPVPDNYIKAWIADLNALELIEPSKKKHPVSDKAAYWSLTEFGREVLKDIRRYRLEQAEPKSSDVPEAPVEKSLAVEEGLEGA